MSSKQSKKKLCWNCEGNISLKADSCPYCGVSLDVSAMRETDSKSDPLAPPYKMMGSVTDHSIPNAPYASPDNAETSAQAEALVPEAESNDFKTIAISVSSLLFGTVFVLFGLLLFLFADNQGVFTLQWHSNYWFIYLLLGLPLLYIGWRTSNQIQDEN